MPVVAVVNRKGGSGKTTLATHLAAWFANGGHAAMLGDVDFQGSAQAWLRRRASQEAVRGKPIVGWSADPRNVLRPPAGVSHVVLDTPGGLRGLDLAKPPGVAETIDWTMALNALGKQEIDADVVEQTLGSVLKYREDIEEVRDETLARLVDTARATAAR